MHNPTVKGSATLLARILLSMLFIVSGFGKINGYGGTEAYMASHGLPGVSFLLPLTILIELGGGLFLLLGAYTRPVAAAIILFLIPVTLVFHTGGDPDSNIHFFKNLGIAGGMLLLVIHGAGTWSIDARRLVRA